MEHADRVRARGIEAAIAAGSVDSDPSWFLRYLTERQKLYAVKFLEFKGDWKAAARAAGYSAGTTQRYIEEGPAMYALMTAVKKQLSDAQLVTAETVAARLNRLALKAEADGELGVAVRATKLLGDMLGVFKAEQPTVQVNADGVIIQIAASRSESDDVIDAEYRTVLERNGIEIPALPQPLEEPA